MASSITESSPLGSDSTTLQGVGSSLKELASDLQEIKPPAEEKTYHGKLIQQIEQTAGTVENSAGQDAQAFKNTLNLSITQIKGTIGSIND